MPFPLCALALAALTPSGSIEPALDSIALDSIRTDIHFLAADEMGGRDTPSPGQRIAARYIRSRLERLGWQPGAPAGYFYTYWLDYLAVDALTSGVTVLGPGGSAELRFGEDYFFHSSNMTNDLFEAGVVFCGAGRKEDFAGVDVEGRWALCWTSDLSWRRRQREAEKAGALGLLVAPGSDYDGEPFSEKYASWADAAHDPRPTWPSGRQRSVYPSSYLTAAAAVQLLQVAGVADPAVGQDLGVAMSDRRVTQGPGGQIELENVAGFWPGSDPELAREVIVVSAHYDHVGTSRGEVYNGADDNGSGTTGLLAVADALAQHGPLRRSVLLLWVSAEEKGLLGSKAWALYPWLPEGYRPICDINIDMIGRNAPNELLVTPTAKLAEHYNELTRIAERMAPSEGFTELKSADDYWSRSDHAMFAQHLELPVCFLFSDVHEDYHMPTDTPDKVDTDKIRRAARLVVRMLDALQEDDPGIPLAPAGVWHTARARGDVRALSVAASHWALAHDGQWPAELAELVTGAEDGRPWLPGRAAIPADPWGRPYRLTHEDTDGDGTPDLVVASHGRDGEPGGEGEDADLSSLDRP